MKTVISSAFLAFALSLSLRSGAQIFYQDIDPDVFISTWNVKDIHIDSVATATLTYGGAGNLSIWQEFGSQIVVNAFSDCQVMMNGSYPAALNLNQQISSAATWVQPNYAILNNGTQGNWIGANDKYLGVRVKNGTQWLNGWIRMDVNTAGSSVTIKDYACNRTADAAISAGQTTTAVPDDRNGMENGIILLPNPVHGHALIRTVKPFAGAVITIYDMQGRSMKEYKDVYGSEVNLRAENLPKGMYLVSLAQRGHKATSLLLIVE